MFVEELVESLVLVCDDRPQKRHGEVVRFDDSTRVLLVNGTDGERDWTFLMFYDSHDDIQSFSYERSGSVGILIDGCDDGSSWILVVLVEMGGRKGRFCYSAEFLNRCHGNSVLEGGKNVTHVTGFGESEGRGSLGEEWGGTCNDGSGDNKITNGQVGEEVDMPEPDEEQAFHGIVKATV